MDLEILELETVFKVKGGNVPKFVLGTLFIFIL